MNLLLLLSMFIIVFIQVRIDGSWSLEGNTAGGGPEYPSSKTTLTLFLFEYKLDSF